MNRNRKRNLFLKKSTAAFAASMLVMTGITPVMAAGGYQEAEKKSVEFCGGVRKRVMGRGAYRLSVSSEGNAVQYNTAVG